MKKKKLLLNVGICSAAILTTAIVIPLAAKNMNISLFATGNSEWVHYNRREATSSVMGIREYWVECGGIYQFEAPATGNITDAGANYDTSEFAEFDDRYFTYAMDEHYHDLTVSSFGAGQYHVSAADYKNWKVTYASDGFTCGLYSDGSNKLLWRIELPRIDYTKYPAVNMKLTAPNWYENNNMGPEADQLTYHTVYGGNKTEGKITLTLGPSGVHMEVNSLEYASTLAFENTFTDSDIIHGLKPAYFYTEDLYDRDLVISNIVLSKESAKTAVMHLNGDTTAITVENGTVGLPGSVDYGIINNGYGNDTNSLVVTGNANPGAAVITMPAVNLNSYLTAGVITFKFGVFNNNEPMYWGSGEGKVALGNNDPASQSNNNNGYVNWELQLTSTSAKVHNVYSDQYYNVTLTAEMLAGTAGIVISGGGTSIYRRYLVTDFYWSASL